MKPFHVPAIDARYWVAITLASIFGTNLGDFYAHQSGLGLLGGLPLLALLFAGVFVAERFDRLSHDLYYWLCIIILRTGATNIADYLAGRRGLSLDRLSLSIALGLALAILAWSAGRKSTCAVQAVRKSLPGTNVRYWLAMLTAGVFGTVLGDFFEKLIGQGMAAVSLTVVFAAALLIYRRATFLRDVYAYWLVIGVARTTGTAIGDWLAESKILKLGLPLSTLLTGVAFAAAVLVWRNRTQAQAATV